MDFFIDTISIYLMTDFFIFELYSNIRPTDPKHQWKHWSLIEMFSDLKEK